MSEENNKNAFLRSVRGVSPIKKQNRIKSLVTEVSADNKKEKINFSKKMNIIQPIVKNQTLKSSVYVLEKSSINRKLKKGKIAIDKKIDFHGLSVLDAEILFINTIKSSYKKNFRCILFVTGKGIRAQGSDIELGTKLYYGKIRNSFFDWIQKNELKKLILSFEPANIEYGADGAFFVYLRKQKI